MISIRLHALKLTLKQGVEEVDFAPHVSFFHGEMSAGKSSIPALIDFCFGADENLTPALNQELVGVSLDLTIGGHRTLLERSVGELNVRVSWQDGSMQAHSCLAPRQETKSSIPLVDGRSDILTLSDLIFYLAGLKTIRVRKRTQDEDSQLIRLSFRDVLKFIYLDQDNLDSDFFRLRQPILKEKSEDVIHWIVGFRSDLLLNLQQSLQSARQKQRVDAETASQLRQFLAQFGYESIQSIDAEIGTLKVEATTLSAELKNLRKSDTSIPEEDQTALRNTTVELVAASESLADLKARIDEQTQLRNQLIAMKMRTAKISASRELFESVDFDACPVCGADVTVDANLPHCYLCKTPSASRAEQDSQKLAIYQADLDSRIDDLGQMVARQEKAVQDVDVKVRELRDARAAVLSRIEEAKQSMETEADVQRRRVYDRLAEIRVETRHLEDVRRMPLKISAIEAEADELNATIARYRREIKAEEARLSQAEKHFQAIESNWKQLLLDIGFPGVSKGDQVVLDRKTLIPAVWPNGEQKRSWDFFSIGSGGKKTLLKITFALALHKTASEFNLGMPNLLMIDSPTKNITPDINKAVFEKFYAVLYDLLSNELANWQVIIVDQTYAAPPDTVGESLHRYMTRTVPGYPPLIPYYTGP